MNSKHINEETSVAKLRKLADRYAKQKNKDLKDLDSYSKQVMKLMEKVDRLDNKYTGTVDYSALIAQRIGQIILKENKKSK